MEILPSEQTPRVRPISALAWVALALGVLTSVWVFWSESSVSNDFYRAVFGPADDGAFLVLLDIYVVAVVVLVIALVIAKGWRSRVIVVAGLIAVVLPIPQAIWMPGLFD